jgi:hypothetical protein
MQQALLPLTVRQNKQARQVKTFLISQYLLREELTISGTTPLGGGPRHDPKKMPGHQDELVRLFAPKSLSPIDQE